MSRDDGDRTRLADVDQVPVVLVAEHFDAELPRGAAEVRLVVLAGAEVERVHPLGRLRLVLAERQRLG